MMHGALAAFDSKKVPTLDLLGIRSETNFCDTAHPCGSDMRKQIGAFPNMSNYSLEYYALKDLGSSEVRACNSGFIYQ